MLVFIVLCILVVAIAQKSEGNGTSIEKLTGCAIADYVLAIQYECSTPTIHGLWPDPSPPCDTCTTEVFSESNISSTTLANMKKYWPTCQSGTTNDSFWAHEWSKHGTCSGKLFSCLKSKFK